MALQIVTGDDTHFVIQLYKHHSTFAIDSGATVRAAVITNDEMWG